MITTGSKFFYGLATVLGLTAMVYGYVTDGSILGVLSFGYKGGVGDHLGYTILWSAAAIALFLGFTQTAFRDADPAATAELLGAESPGQMPVVGASYWPVIGAFGIGLTVVGLVLNNVFFVAGLIALGAVALEWTIQAWADRATGDPAVNREIRNRIMLPVEVPVGGALAIAIVVIGYSRVFLTVSKEGAVFVALAVAAIVFAGGTIFSVQERIRKDLVAGLLAVGAVVTIGLGIFGAVNGEREFEHHGEEHSEEGEDHSGEGEDHSEDGEEDHSEDEGALEESN